MSHAFNEKVEELNICSVFYVCTFSVYEKWKFFVALLLEIYIELNTLNIYNI